MTKEELKQEAEEKAKKRTKGFKCQDNCEKSYVMGALDFAEPREKRIAELEKKLTEKVTLESLDVVSGKIADLEKENAELILGNKSLSAKLMNTTRKKLDLQKENAELKQKFLTVKKDDIRKAKLNECKTYEEKVEYLRQVTNYALFNDDISVMLWCFCQRGEIDTNQLTKAKEIIRELLTCARNYPESNKQKMQKAEQFLKGESTTSNECHDCAKFDEMPKGPRCKTCDNGSHFQKKEEA